MKSQDVRVSPAVMTSFNAVLGRPSLKLISTPGGNAVRHNSGFVDTIEISHSKLKREEARHVRSEIVVNDRYAGRTSMCAGYSMDLLVSST